LGKNIAATARRQNTPRSHNSAAPRELVAYLLIDGVDDFLAGEHGTTLTRIMQMEKLIATRMWWKRRSMPDPRHKVTIDNSALTTD
jgi:hypothetical protein